MKSVDIAIIGGGMVGLAIAVGLKSSGLRIALIEQRELGQHTSVDPLRVSALNMASERFLRRLGAWRNLSHKQAYEHMQVWEQDSFAHLDMSAQSVLQPYLGHIVDNQAVVAALWQELAGSEVSVLSPCNLTQCVRGEQGTVLHLSNQPPLFAHWVIAADGAHSQARHHFDFPVSRWDYGHTAVVATVVSREPHQNCARQIFTPEGPLAFLPLWSPNLCSVVWSVSPEHAAELLAIPSNKFEQQLAAAFDARLGLLELQGGRAAFTLQASYAREVVKDGCILVGDAAHTIHPLAGQGVNLGLMDAAALIETILTLQQQGRLALSAQQFDRYARWRKSEAVQMLALMQGFKQAFSGQNSWKRVLRGLALQGADVMTPIKQACIRRAMGLTGELPGLAR